MKINISRIALIAAILSALFSFSSVSTLLAAQNGEHLSTLGTGMAATDCTIFVSPTGSDTNSGASPNSPLTLLEAAHRTKPGSVVCLLSGTYAVPTPFQITRSGTAASWVVYKSYDGRAVIVPGSENYALMQVVANVQYIEIRGLQFDGQNTAASAIHCKGGDHIRIIGNTIWNTGANGIATQTDPATGKSCDYVVADHNMLYHLGYKPGWGSAISYDGHGWYDNYQGFHSYITNNIISGVFDASIYHSDGNGIILDNDQGANTPPTLVANNVVYQNGGRCIHSRYANNTWIVNNTCYANGLDLSVIGGRYGNNGEIILFGSSENYVINNLVYAWNNRRTYSDEGGTHNTYHNNLWYTAGSSSTYLIYSPSDDEDQLMNADPLFVNAPYINPTAGGQYSTALAPFKITNEFYLRTGSPAIQSGIDPATLAGLSPDIVAGLKQILYTDVEGIERTPGGPFNLGAYQIVLPSQITGITRPLDGTLDSGFNDASPRRLSISRTPLRE